MMRFVTAVFLMSPLVTLLPAQATRNGATRSKILENAIRLGNAGEIAAARGTIDSLTREMPADSADLADVLFARATFASSVLDASLDYEKIIAYLASSPRREESLLRLAQRALMAGDTNKALEYLGTVSRDYPDDSSQALAEYWKARVLLDSHDVSSACASIRMALLHANASSSPLPTDIETQSKASCAISGTTTVPDSKPRTPSPIAATLPVAVTSEYSKLYAVQVSAFARQADADEMSQRLRKTGLDAHVDGTVRPFRVRIGHYKNYAEAAKALSDLKSRKLKGFVTELSR